MRGLMDVAERAAQERCGAIRSNIEAAISAHAEDANIRLDGDELRASGRGLKRRWIGDPGLRFARRISR